MTLNSCDDIFCFVFFFINAVIPPPLKCWECQLDISYHAGKLQEILADTYHTALSGRYPVN